jgi:lysozyme family protein
MSARFRQAFDILLGHEGGFVDDPHDAGGATRYGLSLRFLKGKGRLYDRNQDGVVDAADVRQITLADAQAIYLGEFWNKVRADDLPPALSLLVFDAAVHCGTGTAIRWLQQALKVPVDGAIGPITVARAGLAPNADQVFHLIRMEALTHMGGWKYYSAGWSLRMVRLAFQAMEMR